MKVVAVYNNQMLPNHGGLVFNPDVMVNDDDQMIMVYRDCDHNVQHTHNWIHRLHDDLTLDESYHAHVAFPTIEGDGKRRVWWEDIRFFEHDGERKLTGCVNFGPRGRAPRSARVFVCDMDDHGGTTNHVIIPSPVKYQTHQKNWMFFDHESGLFCTYALHNGRHLVYNVDDDYKKMKLAYVTHHKEPGWDRQYGEIRATSSYIEYEGLLWGCSHSHISRPFPANMQYRLKHRYVYNMGFYAIDPNPPFAVQRMSPKPVYHGDVSDLGMFSQGQHGNGKSVIFPSGFIKRGGKFLVFAGVDDAEIHVVEFDPLELFELTEPVSTNVKPVFETDL